jgi:hypothetical protein
MNMYAKLTLDISDLYISSGINTEIKKKDTTTHIKLDIAIKIKKIPITFINRPTHNSTIQIIFRYL